jgi:single-stranded DNA-specific DHH superfamily exonuclease
MHHHLFCCHHACFWFRSSSDWYDWRRWVFANRPTIVIAIGSDGICKGSGRAPHLYDLGATIMAAAKDGVVVKAGGHKAAIGLTMQVDKLQALHDYMV